jgi:hypothetical protein
VWSESGGGDFGTTEPPPSGKGRPWKYVAVGRPLRPVAVSFSSEVRAQVDAFEPLYQAGHSLIGPLEEPMRWKVMVVHAPTWMRSPSASATAWLVGTGWSSSFK